MFKIPHRITAIDPEYTIKRNHELSRFEVWRRGRFCFVIPFDLLDERTLVYTRKTRRENADEIEREIDEVNACIEREKQKNIEILKAKIKDYVNYDFERFN